MLAVDELTRRFGEITAVDDVSFAVPAGKMTGFVGGNGAGKTTTMRMIMGVLGIHHGEVRWRGRPITMADRRRFGYMPEERGLYPKQPVIDQLVYLGDQPQVITTTPSEQSTRGVARKVEAIWSAVERACERDDFRPKTSALCNWCSFKAFCPAHGGDPAQAVSLSARPGPQRTLDLTGAEAV